jgi:flagellar motor component MotA
MIHWNAELAKRLACSDDDRRALGPLIRRFIDLARKARKEGYLALEADAALAEDPLLTVGLRLVAEGVSGEALEDILATYLMAGEDKGWPFLKACATIEGLVSLSEADDNPLMIRKLVAYYGADRALAVLQELEGSGT